MKEITDVEKNVPKAWILPCRWRDGAESLGMETTSCPYEVFFVRSWRILGSHMCEREMTRFDEQRSEHFEA